MTAIANERCTACRGDSPRLTDKELETLLPEIPQWSVVVADDIPRLQRVFRLSDFASSLALTDRIGALAEEEGHHPAILTEWGRVTVTWWTHKIRGLHRNDLVMAAKTDRIAQSG
jgi:4a-hydroxytetrahydrobiopterin dehydratase